MITTTLLSYILSNAVLIERDSYILFSRNIVNIFISSTVICYSNLFFYYLDKDLTLFNSLFNINANTIYFQIFIFILSLFILNLNGFFSQSKIKANFFIKQEQEQEQQQQEKETSKENFYKKNFIENILFNKKDLSFDKNETINRDENLNKQESYNKVEYCLMVLFIITGASYLISTSDLVSIILSIELQSYGLYLLAALYRDSEWATSAALTYFLLGSLSSCFILLGSSLLYVNSCLTSFDNLYVITNLTPTITSNSWYYYSNYIGISLLIISVGLLFKVSAAPFHFWSPDVYDMIPTIVTTFVAIITKISLFTFFLEIISYTNNQSFSFNWMDGLLFSSLCSLIIGTVLGLTQSRIKKIYAYSTISHIGFILLSLTIYNLESIKSFIFYLTTYSVSNLNGFLILLALGDYLDICKSKQQMKQETETEIETKNKTENKTETETEQGEKKQVKNQDKKSRQSKDFLIDPNLSPIQILTQIKGYFYLNSGLALSLAITLFSFIGIPPLIGFFAKQMVLSAALNKTFVFISLIAIITSVIGAVYYLNIISNVFFTFSKSSFSLNLKTHFLNVTDYLFKYEKKSFNLMHTTVSSCLTFPISIFTLIITFFIFISDQFESISLIGGSIKFKF